MGKVKMGSALAAITAGLSIPVAALGQVQSASDPAVLAAADNFLQSIIWPVKRFGFKSLILGSPVNLDDRKSVSIYKSKKYLGSEVGMRPVENIAIYCASVVFVAGCDLKFWNGYDTPVAAINDLKTAFGEKVNVKFALFLDRAIPSDAAPIIRHGVGRIAAITVENSNRSDAFVNAAVSHFTREMGAEPVKRQSFSNAKAIYSPVCSARVSEIEAKPPLEITIKDNVDYERCQTEALGKILAGNLQSTRTTRYMWSDATSKVDVVITDRSENIGGIVETASSSIDIELDVEQQKKAFQNAAARAAAQRKANQDTARSNDF